MAKVDLNSINLKGGKKNRESQALVDRNRLYNLGEAVELVKKISFAAFDEALEISINLGVDPKYSDQVVRGVSSMPHGIGKDVRVAVFAKGDKLQKALDAGADVVGAEDLVQKIKDTGIDFDVCIAIPDMMGMVGRVAKILGPKGKMPNPKLGTVTVDVEKAIKDAKSGQVKFRAEKAGIVHASVGRVSFEQQKLVDNIKEFIAAVLKARPAGAKGSYMKSIYLCSTMGPSVQLNLLELQN